MLWLSTLITLPRKGRRTTATPGGMTEALDFAAVTPKVRETASEQNPTRPSSRGSAARPNQEMSESSRMASCQECGQNARFAPQPLGSMRHQHRNSGVFQHGPCRPAQNRLAQAGMTIGTHHQHVGIQVHRVLR